LTNIKKSATTLGVAILENFAILVSKKEEMITLDSGIVKRYSPDI